MPIILNYAIQVRCAYYRVNSGSSRYSSPYRYWALNDEDLIDGTLEEGPLAPFSQLNDVSALKKKNSVFVGLILSPDFSAYTASVDRMTRNSRSRF